MYKMSDALGYYKVLEVAEDADAETIKRQYHDLAKLWHPDYNHEAQSTDIFQKISQAYETLSDAKRRKIYDVLSLVYTSENYPDLEVIEPMGDGSGKTSLRAVCLSKTVAWGLSYKSTLLRSATDFSQALQLNLKVSACNWLLGWWHPKALILNIKGLIYNFKNPIAKEESLKILLHNMVAYAKANKPATALQCGLQARKLLSENSPSLEAFLSELNAKTSCPKDWPLGLLKAAQLVVPAIIIGMILLSSTAGKLKDSSTWAFFGKSKEIDYYQKVNFSNGQSVDDVVVGKVLSIPVDKTDHSKLYHVTSSAKVMYGPSDDFDAIKTLEEDTTVRLTGITPDNMWARVLIDNGELGFVHYKDLKQGIGKEIPFGSAIIE